METHLIIMQVLGARIKQCVFKIEEDLKKLAELAAKVSPPAPTFSSVPIRVDL